AGGRVADGLQVFHMAMGVAGFAFGGGTEHGGNVVVALDVGLGGEVHVTTIGHRFAGESVFQILLGLGAFQVCHGVFTSGGERARPDAGQMTVARPACEMKLIDSMVTIAWRYRTGAQRCRSPAASGW